MLCHEHSSKFIVWRALVVCVACTHRTCASNLRGLVGTERVKSKNWWNWITYEIRSNGKSERLDHSTWQNARPRVAKTRARGAARAITALIIITTWDSDFFEDIITQVAKRGGLHEIVTFSKIFFLQKIDFWVTTWSEDTENIFLESLEVFEKFSKKIENFFSGRL